MSTFRFVPRSVLWRYPRAVGVRLPRRRSRRPAIRGADPVAGSQYGNEPTHESGITSLLPRLELSSDETYELAPVNLDEDRSHVRRRLDRLIKTFNDVRVRRS